jgi:Zn finger protein HypA/HybF involved in hydrogenase expression
VKGENMDAYCVKCKAKKEMADAKKVKMKNKRDAMKGKCPDCGTGMYRILAK